MLLSSQAHSKKSFLNKEKRMNRTELIEAARGDRPLDLIIKNVHLVNVFTCEIYPADIGIYQDRIAIVAPANIHQFEAVQTIDGTGKWATPGFVDTHLHIESTMVTPANYAAAVLPFGTTTSIIDPHEIANVMGMDGVKFMVEMSEGLPLRTYITIPSCVPAAPGIETAGAQFGPKEITEMLTWPRVIAVGEVMDYMGVVNGEARMTGIVEAGLEANVTIQGHSPLLIGRDLNAYISAGIENDHELRNGDEGLEKLRLGVLPLLKLSSYGNHIPEILPKLQSAPFLDIALCTDDIEPADLLQNGHMDRVIREVISHGIDPAVAIRWATYNGARHYKLRDHGAIGPGYFADILLLSSLEKVSVSDVFVSGKQVSKNGKLINQIREPKTTIEITNSVHLHANLELKMFQLDAPIRDGVVDVNTIVLEPSRMTHLETISVPVKNHKLILEKEKSDLCYLTVVPRHGQKHPPVTALLKGLHWNRGTMAMTISHDSHNIIVAGHKPSDMLLSVKELEKSGGGIVFVDDGVVLGKIELPLAGLMSLNSVENVAEEITTLNEIAKGLGVSAPSPVLAISGLALTVIPQVRISDLYGLYDSVNQTNIPIFVKSI
jgi:adenine deaminase